MAKNAPALTRRQRADRVKREEAAFFNEMREKCATNGELQFILPAILQILPIDRE
ncbi:MAG: hypothetical protein LBF93_08930 [Zoogloeaceae bacterium]|jgi:hypothetical protein|nr:hypothetical protein [Zoogloeaceae bacterium]